VYINRRVSIILPIFLALMIMIAPLLMLNTSAQTITFPSGTFVVPMDDKQNNVTRAFGFIHAVLRNGGDVYRVIEPPDVTLTTVEAGTDTYAGGVFLIPSVYESIVNAVSTSYPSVTIHRLSSSASIDISQLFYIDEEPSILIIYGTYGRTDILLDEMGIPYTLVYRWSVEDDPSILYNYDIIVIDCPGWWGAVPENIMNIIKEVTYDGAIVVYTDIAMLDANVTFPGYVELMSNIEGIFPCNVHNPPLTGFDPEFLSQYWGPSLIHIFTMRHGYVISNVINTSYVRIFVDSSNYGGSYAVLDAYFPYGSGWVELIAFHPYEQTEDITGDPYSYRAAATIYGNKFIQKSPPTTPTTPPSPPTTTPTTTTTTTVITTTTTTTTLTSINNNNDYTIIGGEISLNTTPRISSKSSIPVVIVVSAIIVGAVVVLMSKKK